MISPIRQALLHILKRHDVLAVVAGNRVHDGGGNDDHQKGHYEERIQSHNENMVRQFFAQSKRKFELLAMETLPTARYTRIGSTTSGMPWL